MQPLKQALNPEFDDFYALQPTTVLWDTFLISKVRSMCYHTSTAAIATCRVVTGVVGPSDITPSI